MVKSVTFNKNIHGSCLTVIVIPGWVIIWVGQSMSSIVGQSEKVLLQLVRDQINQQLSVTTLHKSTHQVCVKGY
ncbi:hypothetical protein L1987_02583 [Smallanthus sonchifolius]|uniref:Uncharacterized protein n=1 Tax=Smallanthus sonchifolius TaxID=185202 RepID=A0ACB9K864_9ASTR|nr:hypothetical protein L1987_02583 [Smallanthus sonchifolius]